MSGTVRNLIRTSNNLAIFIDCVIFVNSVGRQPVSAVTLKGDS